MENDAHKTEQRQKTQRANVYNCVKGRQSGERIDRFGTKRVRKAVKIGDLKLVRLNLGCLNESEDKFTQRLRLKMVVS